MRFVLDGSIAMRWCLTQQQTPESLHVLQLMQEAVAVVPSIWPVEVANVVSRELNKGTIDVDQASTFLQVLSQYDIQVAGPNADVANLFQAARAHRLSAYDATYVELAIELALPIATADDKMKKAAQRAGVSLVL